MMKYGIACEFKDEGFLIIETPLLNKEEAYSKLALLKKQENVIDANPFCIDSMIIFDIWSERMNLETPSYNRDIDDAIFFIAKKLPYNKWNDKFSSYSEIAENLKLPEIFVELALQILAEVSYEVDGKKVHVFGYGCSPRGLWVNNIELAKKFVKEYGNYIEINWD